MNAIAIIPARGGSQRIPHKNILNFMGKPLLAWTIEAAQKSDLFRRIVVSTDDPEIAATAVSFGVDVPFLRQEANDDITPVSIATIAALGQAREHWKEEYDVVVQLMPNCPVRGSVEIIDAYRHFVSQDANFQISCFKFGWMNPWWAFAMGGANGSDFIFKEAATQRSQDLPDLYCPTGAIWIAKAPPLVKEGTFYGGGHIFHPMDWKAAVDIDNDEDIEIARIAYTLTRTAQTPGSGAGS